MRNKRVFLKMEKVLDRQFGQLIMFTPIEQRQSFNEICDVLKDSTRPELTVEAIFETSFIEYKFKNASRANDFGDIIDDYPICLVRHEQLPYKPQKGDLIQLVDTDEKFQISDIKPDGLSRQLLELKISNLEPK